jgi:soluble lytic murein transglycosylase-like protein
VNKRKFILTLPIIFGIITFINIKELDTAEITPRDKISVFIKHNSSLTTKQANILADRFMARGYPEPAIWLAATAKVESDFRMNAVGKAGEVTAFQILVWPEGRDKHCWEDAIDVALAVRREKQLTHKSSPFKALQAYNGNPKLKATKQYALKISEYMRYL